MISYRCAGRMERKYRSNNNIVYSCKYHVVWCPKYRRQVLVQGVDGRLKEVLREVAAETQAAIMEIDAPADSLVMGSAQVGGDWSGWGAVRTASDLR